ncbi:FtsX-like permease family protein [Jatrophihabitans lederbergiae]|uniref:FtsX-like permease family protein n=1 Tax=Jatrophihabitans lederbergiae TaxID=3075547 RepID=A0ABU2J910_9ACTN|nr:FtsX-like permease family protein [Jatrophihabitans sp. DSM 44399]MDT0261462.1 FtsX-like permease family protein [Jatrophihabitans sp. DSM 44399]
MIRIWLPALLRHQPARLLGAAAGVAIAVALLASLGAFLAHAKASMTGRAVRSVSVDWQVQTAAGTDPASVAALVAHTPGVQASQTVGFTRVPGLSATTAGTTQTTGAGVVLGLPPTYQATFPGEIRSLTGSASGVLVAQQTASNLHAAPGSTIAIKRPGLSPVTVTVAGVVDLPQANSLFQTVGAPAGSQPSAPPDNVILLPYQQWQQLSAPIATPRPDLVSTQIHARLSHALPNDPAAAYSTTLASAHNLEARSTGTATVGNNLGAALDSARGDAAYAQVLFLFLGLPGAILAGLLTATVASAGARRRRGEQALLRIRGASQRQLLRLVSVETGVIGAVGCLVGLAAALVVGQVAFGSTSFGATTGSAMLWSGLAVALGLAITALAVLVPARRDVREHTIASGRQEITVRRYPWWARYGLDIAALVGAGLVLNTTSHNGYQLVLAPEGVPTISVSYWALAGPALLWLGAGLLIWRLVDLLLGRGRRITALLLSPFAGRIAPVLGASMSRQRRPLVKAATVLALSVAFAISTATFNTTYQAQAEADAQLTNGADVTVTQSAGVTVGPAYATKLAAVPGVTGVEPLQHRYAYIGTDLQDLYGVQPGSIRSVTALQDSYFLGGSAASLMRTLRTKPDSILVSSETVKDYQLHLGDLINLRLLDGRTHKPITVAFHYVGIVSEFPTAPKDSFFVTNAAYITQKTGSDAVGTFLINTGGTGSSAVAAKVRTLVGPSVAVTGISTTRGTVGSSLTSVDLAGLSRVELGFALVLAAAAGGLVLALGLAERRRSLAIMNALGARRRHLRAAVACETVLVGVTGALGGGLLGAYLTQVLIKVLTGVFDPPPSAVTVPWGYLAALAALIAACLAVVTAAAVRVSGRGILTTIRRL